MWWSEDKESDSFSFRELSSDEPEYLEPSELIQSSEPELSEIQERGTADTYDELKLRIAYFLLGGALFIFLTLGLYKLSEVMERSAALSGKLRGANLLLSPSYLSYSLRAFGDVNTLMSLISTPLIYFDDRGQPVSTKLESIPSRDDGTMGVTPNGKTWVRLIFKKDQSLSAIDYFETYKLMMAPELSETLAGSFTREYVSDIKVIGRAAIMIYSAKFPFPFLPFNFALSKSERGELYSHLSRDILANLQVMSRFLDGDGESKITDYQNFRTAGGMLRLVRVKVASSSEVNVYMAQSSSQFLSLMRNWNRRGAKAKSIFIMTLRDLWQLRDEQSLTGYTLYLRPSYSLYVVLISDRLPLDERRSIVSSLGCVNWWKVLGFEALAHDLRLEIQGRDLSQRSYLPIVHYAYQPQEIPCEPSEEVNTRAFQLIYSKDDVFASAIAEGISRRLKVSLKPLTSEAYRDRLSRGQYQLAIAELTIPPHIPEVALLGRGGSLGFSDERLQELAESIDEQGYSRRQISLYHELQRYLVEKALVLPVINEYVITVARRTVSPIGGASPVGVWLR